MKQTIAKFICLLLVAVSIGLLFLPCWTMNDQGVSIAEYIYRPSQYRSLTTSLRDTMGRKKLANVIALPIFLLLAGCIALLAAGILRFKTKAPAVCCLCVGVLGSLVCLTNPILKCGSLWGLLLALYSCALLTGIVGTLLCRGEKAKRK